MNKIEQIIEKLKNEKIAILGFGKEGISTYEFIRRYLPDKYLEILDLKDIRDNEILTGDNNVGFIIGENYLDSLEKYDLIIKTPGVVLKDIDITNIKDKITSQMELLLEVYKDNTIAITGTKGKTTTASLLYEILKNNNTDARLLGNIGLPVLDEIENINDNTVLVLEMSSFQIEYLKVAPHIAIILNLFIDHLNHAGTVEAYHKSKLNIFEKQNKDDIGIYISDTEPLNEKVRKANYKHISYKVSLDRLDEENNIYVENGYVIFNNERIYNIDDERNLKGVHILKNIMSILVISELFGLDRNITNKTINEFIPLPHRMEFVIEKEGVKYYNDSIATIPEATICSIETLGDIDTLIIGGSDKGSDYNKLIEFLRNSSIRNIIFMPDTGYMLKEELERLGTDKNLYLIEKLADAVKLAKEITEKGKSCLMSPAAANFTEYANYVAKGNAFKELVKEGE